MPSKSDIRAAVQYQLPPQFQPLHLTFCRNEVDESELYTVIGNDYASKFRALHVDGTVHSVDPAGKLPSRFVNMGIAQLSASINAFQQYLDEAERAHFPLIARHLRDRLVAIDPKALSHGENWWALVLEQVDDGLL